VIRIPTKIKELIGKQSYEIDDVGKSNANILCFKNMILKVEKECEETNNEHRMMKWMKDKLPVPEVICLEKEDGMNCLLMSKIEGDMGRSEKFLSNPQELAKIAADGLKKLWGVDIKECPYDITLEHRLEFAEKNVNEGLCDLDDAEEGTYGKNGFESPKELLEWLKKYKPSNEDVVFSHGDYCMSNVIIKDIYVNGFIDLGKCGVADRYQDIALCYRDLMHHAQGFEPKMLFGPLGIEPNWEKIRYYILLDELF